MTVYFNCSGNCSDFFIHNFSCMQNQTIPACFETAQPVVSPVLVWIYLVLGVLFIIWVVHSMIRDERDKKNSDLG